MKQPVAGAGVQGCGPPKLASAVKPTLGYVVAKLISAVLIVRSEAAAEDSWADILARIKFGIAMAAMIRMIATTTSSSINEKPFCSWRILRFLLLVPGIFPNLPPSICSQCALSAMVLRKPSKRSWRLYVRMEEWVSG